jgi:hypothetical protein
VPLQEKAAEATSFFTGLAGVAGFAATVSASMLPTGSFFCPFWQAISTTLSANTMAVANFSLFIFHFSLL